MGKTTLKEFEAVFPQLMQDVTQECQKSQLPQQALTWFQNVRVWSLFACKSDNHSQWSTTLSAENVTAACQ